MSFAPFPTNLISLKNDLVLDEDAERQQRTAIELLSRLAQQPGVVLADEVGMGKTFVALAVASAVILSGHRSGPVVVMVPPSLKAKWPKDWAFFRKKCLSAQAAASIRDGQANSGVEFLKLLDDPPERRRHLVFLTHGALNRTLSDGWIKLALIKRAFKGRSTLADQRRAFGKFAGRLLNLRYIEDIAPELLGSLMERPFEDWLRAIRRTDGRLEVRVTDDPVPAHIQRVLDEMDSGELEGLVEALRQLPLRESSGVDDRLASVRAVVNDATGRLWSTALRRAAFTSPLLILDEAHHLKNPSTRLASLFVDEEAAKDSEMFAQAGPLGGKFERMLFLTATPFQLGHGELLRVLERFEGISWQPRSAPAMTRPEFMQRLNDLGRVLDKAQASALRLDRVWGGLTAAHLVGLDGLPRKVDEWWSSVDRREADVTTSQILDQVDATKIAMADAEVALAPWVLRHLKSTCLPEAPDTLRRTLLPGAAITDLQSIHRGLPIDAESLLPFLLAGRAQVLFASTTKGRALFAEGLASSFEAYLETRDGERDRDEDEALTGDQTTEEVDWYLRHLNTLLRQNTTSRAGHPKLKATAERAIELWRRGEKVLIFCHYRATGRALRQHISALLEEEIVQLGLTKLPDLDRQGVLDHLDAIGERFFDDDGPLRREITEALGEIIAPFGADLHSDHERIIDVVRRFLRTPSFLVRYFALDRANNPEAFVDALDERDESGLSLRQKVRDFCAFLARCIPEERTTYLDALDKIQTGSHGGKDVRAVFDKGEGSVDTALWPNVRLANGDVKDETKKRLLLGFNTPLFPEILIASSVLAEGVDLHLNCRYLIHHDLCWNPSTLEQRSGRIDRINCKAEKVKQPIHLFLPYVAATQDEKMYKVVKDRERWFQIVMGGQYDTDEQATDRRAERVELPTQLQRELSLHLAPNPTEVD